MEHLGRLSVSRYQGILFAVSAATLLFAADSYQADRERMVREQIEARGVHRTDLLRAMRGTPRHLFIPASVRFMAYDDRPVPIGYDATISQPYIVGWMTELLDPRKTDRVLEIGTGSGYQAAILAQLASHVYSIEIVPELAESARSLIRDLGHSNVTVLHGDGYRGWPEKAPFQKIIVTAAPPEIPKALLDQLARGGRLVAPVGRTINQKLTVIEKDAQGRVRRREVGDVVFVPMRPGE